MFSSQSPIFQKLKVSLIPSHQYFWPGSSHSQSWRSPLDLNYTTSHWLLIQHLESNLQNIPSAKSTVLHTLKAFLNSIKKIYSQWDYAYKEHSTLLPGLTHFRTLNKSLFSFNHHLRGSHDLSAQRTQKMTSRE